MHITISVAISLGLPESQNDTESNAPYMAT